MRKALRGVELKYTTMEKKWCALVQVVERFREYTWNAKGMAYLPQPIVKQILSQQECWGRRGI